MIPWIYIQPSYDPFMADYKSVFDAHAGDPMPAGDLERILTASRDAGLKRFLFHCTLELGAAEWRVISSMCGRPWVEDPPTATGRWTPTTPTRPRVGHRRRE